MNDAEINLEKIPKTFGKSYWPFSDGGDIIIKKPAKVSQRR